MAEALSQIQLKEIEQEIDEIVARAEVLDPSNPHDSEILYFDDLKLDEHIAVLESSYRKARINESGLRVV
jgi:hypothetical protein